MIRSVVFDWGGVISPAGTPDEVVVSLAKVLGATPERAREGFAAHAEEFKRGKITEEMFWQLLEEEFSVTVPSSRRSIWTDVALFAPNKMLMQYINMLQKERYLISILSNTFPPTAADLRGTGWYDPFETVILSSEVGFAKPDKEIYEMLLQKTGFSPEETVFIDDQERCLVPARKLGIHCVKAESVDQIIADVSSVIGRGL